MSVEHATLGGGCFWCLEAVFERLAGVRSVTSGYAGGAVENPGYGAVSRGTTGHAEVVRVEYEPSVIPYRDLLGVFFATHDPTTPDRQGADTGPQYRSIILYESDAQRATAESVLKELEREGVFDAPVVTELEPLERFWPAEPYHQEYYRNNPNQPYCRVVIDPKVAKLRSKFADRLKAASG
ncbi:MAG TPA: peptide-methionine (S)-S-oxide reductase MsrA [Longimicrobiales bacterium]|nr:peptide-methionine (S)-S-oxide reductase MsrA [Longimicrobiales bacterium]